MPKELFPFRYRDGLTGKWVRARYLAERHVIADCYKEWEITGPPEIRGDREYGHFSPFPPAPMHLRHIARGPELGTGSGT